MWWKIILTAFVGLARVGAIWAKKRVYRKAFQSASVILITIIIIKIDKNRNDEYERNKKLYKDFNNDKLGDT